MKLQFKNKAQEIVNDLTILLKSLNQKLIATKKKNNTKLIIFTIIGGFISIDLSMKMGIAYSDNPIFPLLFLIFIIIGTIGICMAIRLRTDYYISKYMDEYRYIKKNHLDILEDIDKTNSLDEILQKIENLYLIIIQVKDKKEDKEGHSLLKVIYAKEIEFCSLILSDLRSDLLIRLTEQQESLKSAKSEIKSHIKGTTELDQVSEHQRIRLDKQIEQFEELQRVLVKK